MCGKFTAMASWAEAVRLSKALIAGRDNPAGPDRELTFRVMSNLPLIVWDRDQQRRRVLTARWGFPHPNDWRRPQPIHARAETIETTKAFAGAFLDGQRGIVLVRSFNEAPDVKGPTIQHTITPGADGPLGIAFVWRKFEIGAPQPLYACVMVTVPANQIIATLPTDRMPAVLAAEDWGKWLGEEPATVDAVYARNLCSRRRKKMRSALERTSTPPSCSTSGETYPRRARKVSLSAVR